MDDRNEFAKAAMQAILGRSDTFSRSADHFPDLAKEVADASFQVADAMISESGRPSETEPEFRSKQ